MLDIRYITNNVEKVKQSAKEKGYHVDIDRLLELDVQRRQKMTAADELLRAVLLKNKWLPLRLSWLRC